MLLVVCQLSRDRSLTSHEERKVTEIRYGNRAKITLLMCEEKPYPVWFSCRRKSSLFKLEISRKGLIMALLTDDQYHREVIGQSGK